MYVYMSLPIVGGRASRSIDPRFAHGRPFKTFRRRVGRGIRFDFTTEGADFEDRTYTNPRRSIGVVVGRALRRRLEPGSFLWVELRRCRDLSRRFVLIYARKRPGIAGRRGKGRGFSRIDLKRGVDRL